MNLDEIKRLVRDVNIGRELHLYTSNSIPNINQVSTSQMAWVTAAVLYCDISGYTRLTNTNRNETVARVLIAFHSSMVQITNQLQGKILGFAGDRVMALFAGSKEQCANNSVQCGLAMQTIVRSILNEEFKVRNFQIDLTCSIGIDYGTVLMGEFGAGQSTDLVFVGNAANIAAKLQANAGKNKTYITEIVYNTLNEQNKSYNWSLKRLILPGLGELRGWKTKNNF